MRDLIQDLQYGIRVLARNPTFTLIALLALALGIGATTAIFSVVDTVLLKPLPYPRSDRIVSVGLTVFGGSIARAGAGLSRMARAQSCLRGDGGVQQRKSNFDGRR